MFTDDLKLLLRFKTSSLYEEVSQSYLKVVGNDSTVQMVSGGGYAMKDNQYLLGEGITSVGYNFDISTEFTIGFWLYSVNPGIYIDEITGFPVSIEMPFLDFNGIGSNNISIIRISEKTITDGKNYLTIYFGGGTDYDYSASTESYSSNQWHHFWINYNGATSSISIYVDGKLQSLQNVVGAVSPSLSGTYLDLYVNYSLDGYSSSMSKNYGYLNDLFVCNTVHTSEKEVQRNINDGVMYIVDEDYKNTYIDKFCIGFNDPNTITINSLIDDMSYVYIGRNDGKILRGSPLFWENRKSFSNLEEIRLLGLEDDNLQDGFLNLKNKNVRL